ncbi:nitric oxide-associated protein 1 isoform X3 [Apis laboriosa]|uniref:nitric oxide-associated protein 1 isoform X3 n=1 Tax=Apis laboriosa TaxID=183418 RepID=UPI001CC686C6|nr:nitric oxide-associated protein 1 isoform X3 [Apis laboriosa]
MQTSNLKFYLFQLCNHNMYHNLGLQQFKKTILYRNIGSKVNPKVLSLRNKLLYCDYLDYGEIGYAKHKKIEKQRIKQEEKMKFEMSEKKTYSIMLNEWLKDKKETNILKEKKDEEKIDKCENENVKKQKPIYMPYAAVDSYEITDTKMLDDTNTEKTNINLPNEKYKELFEKYLQIKQNTLNNNKNISMLENVEKNNKIPKGELWKIPSTWMTDYEHFDDTLLNECWYNYYGTPNPNSEVSSIPCGGCGALLHCKDPEIPGYLPLELFSKNDDEDLKSTICQRCHFLKFYNAALEVKVSIEDYPNLLKVIKTKKCAIILIIDLTDFPCSIWPDLKSIMHPFTPIFLVGNKIDLLPRDSPKFLENIKQLLANTVVHVTGVKKENITHIQLISAKTGFGIEELINKLQYKWRYKGDVYLVGCTNVGKSSLFNTLLNSDYCKVKAIDLVQCATISAWPGTTLNLLKFPILNPNGKKYLLRVQRLIKEKFYKIQESKYRDYKFKETGNMKFATLEGFIDDVGKSFSKYSKKDESIDPFLEKSYKFMTKKIFLNESESEYEHSRWCYDTPGTIQKDQILDLLTTDELLLTLPQEIITPRTFVLKPKQTIFVAGMGRLDYLEGEYFIRGGI